MAEAVVSTDLNPTHEEFAALLAESLSKEDILEGSVVKGKVVGLEKDVAVIDVGLKMEGRVAVREFSTPGNPVELKVGDVVEVYLERVENALGEAVLSREKRAVRRAGPDSRSSSRRARRLAASYSTR